VYEAVKTASNARSFKGFPKLTYIYTSGCWVHGDSQELANESTPLGRDESIPEMVAWRPAFEQKILREREYVDVIIFRPSLLLGGDGSTRKHWFENFDRGKKHRHATVSQDLKKEET